MTRLESRSAYRPTEVSPPGETLLEILEERGLSQTELAARCGVSDKHVNGVVRGHDPISPRFALSLEKVLDVPAEFWNSREARYQAYRARIEEENQQLSQLDWLLSFPLKEMKKRSLLSRSDRSTQTLNELLHFLGVSAPENWEKWWNERQPAFRFSGTSSPNSPALAVWLRAGEKDAAGWRCPEFNPQAFSRSLNGTLKGMTRLTPEEFLPAMTAECCRHGVRLAITPAFTGSGVSGAARWLSPTAPLIQLSFRYRSDDMFWFAFYHEACHILRHAKRSTFLQDGLFVANDADEVEANRFAADLLIPPAAYAAFRSVPPSLEGILQFADSQGISPGIVVGRLQHDKVISYRAFNHLKQKMPV